MDADFRISDQGTIVMFTPLTEAGKDFLARCDSEPWQWLGPSLCVDRRPAIELANYAKMEGLTLRQ
jgi:hypothetical protein